MITIIATIKPEHLSNIRSGMKKYEVRKTVPIKGFPFRVLCCESGSGGDIKAEFTVDTVLSGIGFRNARCAGTCLDWGQLRDYIGDGVFYEWHITNMIDYCSAKDHRVRNVSEFGLKRAPQSWCYVKEALG